MYRNDYVFYRLNVLPRSSKNKFDKHLILFRGISVHFIECKIFKIKDRLGSTDKIMG